MKNTNARNACAGNIAMTSGIASGATAEITATDITLIVIVIAGTRISMAVGIIAVTATMIKHRRADIKADIKKRPSDFPDGPFFVSVQKSGLVRFLPDAHPVERAVHEEKRNREESRGQRVRHV